MPKAFSPILDINTTANTYSLGDNCYYCTVAALRNQTVDDLVRDSEIMQDKFANLKDILSLFAEAGMKNIEYRSYDEKGKFMNEILKSMPKNSGLGLAYTRNNSKTGHMVVLAKDTNGEVKCVDYQKNPPSILGVLPEPNITKVYVFYIDEN